MDIDQIIRASRLKEARVALSLTQEQVAQSVDLRRTAIVQIESANRAVSTMELAKLTQLYDRSSSPRMCGQRSRATFQINSTDWKLRILPASSKNPCHRPERSSTRAWN